MHDRIVNYKIQKYSTRQRTFIFYVFYSWLSMIIFMLNKFEWINHTVRSRYGNRRHTNRPFQSQISG